LPKNGVFAIIDGNFAAAEKTAKVTPLRLLTLPFRDLQNLHQKETHQNSLRSSPGQIKNSLKQKHAYTFQPKAGAS
jgi:hypothetical protein